MLGQPIPVLTHVVVGVRLAGRMRPGVTATDLALTVTQALREKGVVDRFVEFFGPGLEHLALADRATVANMAPEYGATMGFFPVDGETLRYLRETGRDQRQVELVERYCKAQGLFRAADSPDPEYSDTLALDLAAIEPSVAGPKRPQDRTSVRDVPAAFRAALTAPAKERGFGVAAGEAGRVVEIEGGGALRHGSVVIASITSCTNTSNPSLLIAAGLLAKKAVERGLTVAPAVKTSLAPGSRVVTAYLRRSGLLPYLERLGFDVVAYGCATCIGNSGPIAPRIEQAIRDGHLVAAAVLSGNRNFEGRIHPLTRANYLCSPPLVVAFALAGAVDVNLVEDVIARDREGRPVRLADLWPGDDEIAEQARLAGDPRLYRDLYRDIAASNPAWNALESEASPVYAWPAGSTYIEEPPFVRAVAPVPEPPADVAGASVLGFFGDFITTDHISPAGSIPADSPAGAYLVSRGVSPADFNSYGARRGSHEVMVRGTFANIRIRNRLADREGGWTVFLPTGEPLPIYDAALRYREAGIPLVVLAGRMYGAGSSRDWAAKGTRLLGVRAVIAGSFERIHRSNLVEMGVLPLEFQPGETADTLGLTGRERIAIGGIASGLAPGKLLPVTATAEGGVRREFRVKCRIDSAIEADYFRHGGILPYVFRDALRAAD